MKKKVKKKKLNLRKLSILQTIIDLSKINLKGFSTIKKIVTYAAVTGFVLLIFLSSILFHVNDRFNKSNIIFKVGPGEAATFISYNLRNQGIIPSIIGFRLIAKAFGVENKFHVGEYKLNSGMNLIKVLNTLQEKGALSLTSGTPVTIPEGYSIIEIADLLEQKGICSAQAFKKLAFSGKNSATAQKYHFTQDIPIASLEGYLFPDTYILPKNTSPNTVLDIMLQSFAQKIYPLRKKIATNDLSFHQLITIASIIEKEAVVAEEREVIAGVFKNRLKFRMYLGSCPTVKYAMGQPRLPYLLYKHLNINHPYNTYRKIGLPPGPIASPGIKSIQAALNPLETKYLYFVSKGDGTHIFTSSLDEHIQMQNIMQRQTGGKIY